MLEQQLQLIQNVIAWPLQVTRKMLKTIPLSKDGYIPWIVTGAGDAGACCCKTATPTHVMVETR